jgi:hypothetical protein
VRDFSVQPRIAGDDSDAEDFDLWGLDEQQGCLLIGTAGARFVLINDDFLSFLRPECNGA